MKVRNLLKPDRVLIAVVLIQMISYLFYAFGITKSFRITYVSVNLVGILSLGIYYYVQITTTLLAEKSKYIRKSLCCMSKNRVIRISLVYLVIAFVGFANLTVNLIRNYSISRLYYIILRNRQIDELTYGNGNTILCNFCIVSLMLLTLILERKDKKTWLLFFLNFGFLILYASFLASRILIIQGLLFCLIIFARRFLYRYHVGGKLIVLTVIMAVFLVLTSGFRDYDQEGYRYTNSKIAWGISRIEDYVISTVNTSLEINSYVEDKPSTFPQNTFELFNKISTIKKEGTRYSNYTWRTQVGAGEYTNIGAFAQIYCDWKMLFIIPAMLLAILYLKVWKAFDKGKIYGYMIWPLFFYNIIETWRINYLGTAMAQVLLLICIASCFVLRKDFVYREE